MDSSPRLTSPVGLAATYLDGTQARMASVLVFQALLAFLIACLPDDVTRRMFC